MFLHQHPYAPFLYKGVQKLIVGTLPPPRFSTGNLRSGDVNFCYGSRDGQLWPILDRIFNLNLEYATTQNAITQRQNFLKQRQIGICDIVAQAQRQKIDATDLGMQNLVLRPLLDVLAQYNTVHTLLFTGGNSKNGPEYFFRKILKANQIKFKVVSDQVPRKHVFLHPKTNKTIQTISLTAPSGAANRAVGSLASYKALKNKNPSFTTIDFRVLQYQPYF